MKIPSFNIDAKGLMKPAIILLVILMLYYFVSVIIRKIKANKELKAIDEELKPEALTYPLNQYVGWANQLEEAMAYLGTDEQLIYSIFSKQTNLSDILQLQKAFGERNYYYWGGKATLSVWIRNELDRKEIDNVNDILTRKNINYQY